jgi:hypothetical protein
VETHVLAPSGSNGNQTGPAVGIGVGTTNTMVFQFVVEAAGGSPTVTFQFQGSIDNEYWYPIAYVTDSSDTVSTASRVMTATGASVCFLSNPIARAYNYVRVVVSGINNITYRAEAYGLI